MEITVIKTIGRNKVRRLTKKYPVYDHNKGFIGWFSSVENVRTALHLDESKYNIVYKNRDYNDLVGYIRNIYIFPKSISTKACLI